MRFHKFKGSTARNIVLADSQLKHLRFPNANILSLPGARIRDLSEYYPSKGQYDRIVLCIGGNDLFKGFRQSTAEPYEVAKELALLADELVPLASKQVYVIAIPTRGQDTANKKRAKATNDYLKDLAENSRWEYRGICCEIYCRKTSRRRRRPPDWLCSRRHLHNIEKEDYISGKLLDCSKSAWALSGFGVFWFV